jgi:hypothetical protein
MGNGSVGVIVEIPNVLWKFDSPRVIDCHIVHAIKGMSSDDGRHLHLSGHAAMHEVMDISIDLVLGNGARPPNQIMLRWMRSC